VTITDVNDNLPIITPGQTFNIAENSANTTSVGIVVATDADTVGSLQNWQITGGNTDSIFVIDSATGEITIDDNTFLDREHAASYTLTLTVDDGANTSLAETVVINIDDVDEFDVTLIVDTDSAANNIDENVAVDTPVGITANSVDGDATDTVTYSLDDNAGGLFKIDANTGVVTVSGTIDAETSQSHTIIVRATSTDLSTTTQLFTITVNDLDEFDTTAVVDNDPAANEVNENSSVDTPIGVIAFADDGDVTDTITYSLDDDASGLFKIDSVTGEVTVDGALNFENATSHNITIRATSTDLSFRTLTLTIQILDVNEAPFDLDLAGGNVDENAATKRIKIISSPCRSWTRGG